MLGRSPKNYVPESSYIYLKLTGDFDPAIVAKAIPIIPHESWAKHSRFPDRKIPVTSIVSYARHDTHADIPDVYLLTEKLADTIEPHLEAISQAIEEHKMKCCLQVVLLFSSDDAISTPIIGFTERISRLLSALPASLDIDTYRT
jgi:hypothetical protein